MNEEETDKLLNILKKNENSISNGDKRIVLTDLVVQRLNDLMNAEGTFDNFNVPDRKVKTDPIKSAQLLNKLIKTADLKIIKDVVDIENTISVSGLKNVKILEIENVNISNINGLNVLRPHLQKLVCKKNLANLKSLLEFCGNDYSSKHIWDELKVLIISYNYINTLDNSLETVPWLHTLDISHNELTALDEINFLVNLKHLNLSYNKIQKLPQFAGQICNRLQILNLSNNLIEDLSSLKNLVNISVLDLSGNCLTDHISLISLSHLATLQWLCLRRNPLSYHLEHRQKSCAHLNVNIDPKRFILDQLNLNKREMKVLGTFYPLLRKSNEDLLASNSTNNLSMLSDRLKKSRMVDIEEVSKSNENSVPNLTSSCSSVEHLEIKNHIQNLRQTYGESWLNYYRSPVDVNQSSEPKEEKSSNLLSSNNSEFENEKNVIKNVENQEIVVIENTVAEIENQYYPDTEINDNENNFDDEIDVQGEENIYFAQISGKTEDILIVITDVSLSERDCITSKEYEKWSLDSIINCQLTNEDHTELIINFDMLRKDKKQRSYILQQEDAERLNESINYFINNRKEKVNSGYKCMRCLFQFPKVNGFRRDNITCPKCDSTIIVEDLLDN